MSLSALRERGYIIAAINSGATDYVRCAEQLAESLKHWHSDADITIVTQDQLPHGDQGGQANDWQLWELSPYHETIKLEADMLVCSPVDHWWTMLRHRDMVISVGCRNWQDKPTHSRAYRRVFDDNNLPDVYNAMTYWRVSHTARDFFRWCRRIWQDWSQYRTLLKFSPDQPDTDLVYAMAAMIVGPEKVTLPIPFAQITHMKQHTAGTHGRDWTQELIWEYHQGQLRIQTMTQWGLFHYHKKSWDPR